MEEVMETQNLTPETLNPVKNERWKENAESERVAWVDQVMWVEQILWVDQEELGLDEKGLDWSQNN